MKDSTTPNDRRPASSTEPVPIESAVRAVEVLAAIRMMAASGVLATDCPQVLVLDCPLCEGSEGYMSLVLAGGGMQCSNAAAAHSTQDLAALLLKAAVRKTRPTDPDDPAVTFCLRALVCRRGDA